MITYADVDSTLYGVASKYAAESQGIIAGSDEKKGAARGKSRSRLEKMAETAGILAGDVIHNKPQIEIRGSWTIVPISRKESDIANDVEVKSGLFKTYISSIQVGTKYHFRFAK